MPTLSPPNGALQQRQRLAAYAVLVRGRSATAEVLLTRLSSITASEGSWTLPGGGVDHGEDPRDTVRREVLEETGLHVEPGELLDVRSSHFVGAGPRGVVDDYHGVQLVFAGEVLAQSHDVVPHVVEQDGSTDRAAWIPFASLADLAIVDLVVFALPWVERALA